MKAIIETFVKRFLLKKNYLSELMCYDAHFGGRLNTYVHVYVCVEAKDHFSWPNGQFIMAIYLSNNS